MTKPSRITPSEQQRNENWVMDWLILLGILVLWVILQVWVLPKAGVPT